MPGGGGGALKSLKPKIQSVDIQAAAGWGIAAAAGAIWVVQHFFQLSFMRACGSDEEACKVTCIVCKVLFFEQGRLLKSLKCVAKPTPADESSQIPIALGDGEIGSSDDGMPPPSVWGAM
ncbi:hypothetical protein Bca4012_002389 [Brassica carinata]|uniref:Uncharacterized protein n=1 Tax=Brassica carinata TaxID=52824 RepID=A0A8X7RZ41_BRACI|nr:hypothetical protein Bca52824_042847 [Brassica carinata]